MKGTPCTSAAVRSSVMTCPSDRHPPAAAAATTARPGVRGLHSSASQLNLSRV